MEFAGDVEGGGGWAGNTAEGREAKIGWPPEGILKRGYRKMGE